jgi:hypothetical protein
MSAGAAAKSAGVVNRKRIVAIRIVRALLFGPLIANGNKLARHFTTESRRHREKLKNGLAGPGVSASSSRSIEITEVTEVTEKKTRLAFDFAGSRRADDSQEFKPRESSLCDLSVTSVISKLWEDAAVASSRRGHFKGFLCVSVSLW